MRILPRGPTLAVTLALTAFGAAAPQASARTEPTTPFVAPSGQNNLYVPPTAGRREESAPFDLPPEDGHAALARATQGLVAWFVALGPPLADEPFGSYVVRAARLMLGRPYGYTVEVPGQEVVDCNVSQFQCESYVESSLAVARCGWLGEPDVACFRREVARMRYRHGAVRGYSSRLHYFEDWLADNAGRGTLVLTTAQLGGKKLQRATAYMTDHRLSYPALQDGNELQKIVATERRLSRRPVAVVLRHDVAAAERSLQDGDIVAIVTRRPDILVHHAGLVERDTHNNIHLLHASSAHRKVIRTAEGISAYVLRRPERQGIMVARPNVPERPRAQMRTGAPAAPGAAGAHAAPTSKRRAAPAFKPRARPVPPASPAP